VKRSWKLWAIEGRMPDKDWTGWALLGVHWFSAYLSKRDFGFDGPGVALFRTRQHARNRLGVVRDQGLRARPVRVVCEVRTVEAGK